VENLADPIIYEEEDLIPKRVPVRLGKREYVLVEAGAEAARLYRNAMVRGMELNEQGKATKAGNLADTQIILVQNCLFEIITAPNGTKKERPADPSWVKQLPDRIINHLFQRSKDISPTLRDRAPEAPKQFDEDEAKKSPDATVES
jgi:hypothetical protein